MTLPFMAVGARGVVSVASNRIPGEVSALVNCALKGDFAGAAKLHARYYTLFKDLFIEPNPVPIKWALHRTGMMSPDVRLPLCPMSEANRARLETVLQNLNLLS
jgi:4-hydroxy-tetrahydrodipicolinate synthase